MLEIVLLRGGCLLLFSTPTCILYESAAVPTTPSIDCEILFLFSPAAPVSAARQPGLWLALADRVALTLMLRRVARHLAAFCHSGSAGCSSRRSCSLRYHYSLCLALITCG